MAKIIEMFPAKSFEDRPVTLRDLAIFKIDLIEATRIMIKEQQQPSGPENLTSNEVRRLLGINDRKLRSLRDKGVISCTRRGNNWYYNPQEIDAYLENRAQPCCCCKKNTSCH